jgi:acetolactate synthase-1/2/3 large subunit
MNGAESLVRTLIASGVEVCFANPGTSEIHFVAALDKTSGMRAILCLFEGVATGAADGYGRMAEKTRLYSIASRSRSREWFGKSA